MATTANPACARNLPQHFNGCACTPTPGGPTAEVDIDLSEMGSSAADLLMEQIEAVRREAYEAGQRDAFAKAADLVEVGLDGGLDAVQGHEIEMSVGSPFRLHQVHLDGIALKALKGQAASLRAYANGAFGAESSVYISAKRSNQGLAPQPGDTVKCPKCDGSGYGYRISDTLASGSCDACDSTGTQTVPGDDAVECTYCLGSGMTNPTTECPVCRLGKMAPTPPGQDEVFIPGYGNFSRVRDGVSASNPYAMRFEADRDLTDDEIRQMAQVIGYNYRASVRGEPLGYPHRDSARSFIVSADTTKSRSDDIGVALSEFEDNLPDMLADGSPVRTTDRAGAGTKGTRLVEGLGASAPSISLYYDDVYQEPSR